MEAEQQLEQRRFAAARRAGDRDRIAGGDGQAGAKQDLRPAAAVSEEHACKFDAAGEGGLAASGPGRGIVLGWLECDCGASTAMRVARFPNGHQVGAAWPGTRE